MNKEIQFLVGCCPIHLSIARFWYQWISYVVGVTCVAGVPVCAWKSWAAKPRAVWNGNTRFKFQKRETGHFVATPTWLVTLRDWLLSQVQLPSIPVTQPKQHNHHLWYLATWHPYKENCSNHANGIFQVKCLNSVSQKRATPYLCIGPNKL